MEWPIRTIPRYSRLDIIRGVGYPTAHRRGLIIVALDEQHIALPKLYGAPAYARPAPVVDQTPRPFDPDDLPIEAVMTPEEREIAASLPAHAYAPGGAHLVSVGGGSSAQPTLSPRPLSLRALAGRIMRQPDSRAS
jgi:hypothetical protein